MKESGVSVGMKYNKINPFSTAIIFLILSLLVAGCSTEEAEPAPALTSSDVERIVRAQLVQSATPAPSLSREDVEDIVRSANASVPQSTSQPSLSRDDIRQIVDSAISRIPQPEPPQPGITAAAVQRIVQAAVSGIPRPDQSLSAAEVKSIVQAAIDSQPDPVPTLTPDEIEGLIVQTVFEAISEVVEPEPRLTREEVRRLARYAVASMPLKSSPAEYTKFFVQNAISRYDEEGLDDAIDYYNSEDSVDGQWYVFIIDENDKVISHYDAHLIGEDLNGPIGTDANGYNFGPEMLSATEDGKWVSYVFHNPEMADITPGELSQVDLKNVWVVRHDGLLFASGWYVDVDQFTQDLVAAVMELFVSRGLENTILALSQDPRNILGGVAESAVSYNASGAVQGEWSIFIADGDGTVQFHFNPERIGIPIEDWIGEDASEIDDVGAWLTSDTMRIWAVNSGGWMFGAGWRDGQS